ncbi:cyclic diguanylate phosphodiesterase [Aeromonas sp. JL9]|uniref:EAL domain-containing protein n=1 Tax=Aeromonas sp. JL9 TaxID=2950549 RepID=UPI00210B99C0|nr:cyclic diguanylate phosphodiesterase [Aeromonas sp. JL9]MCQ4111587.1 cyclic diguanylate phosphodiesterase [Aeromonas sp. JL9]
MQSIKDNFLSRLTIFTSVLASSFLTLSSLMYIAFISDTEKWILSSAKKTSNAIESILDYGEMSNISALRVKGMPCKEAALELRRQVAVVPYIRSVNLARNDKIYCTSIFGDSDFRDSREHYKDGKLLLMSGNRVQESHPIIAIRNEDGDTASISGIDSIYFSKLLAQQEGDYLLLSLHINDAWLTENGLFSHENPVKYLVMSQYSKSDRYPFIVYAGLNFRTTFDAFWKEDSNYIIGLFILLASFATVMWWQLNRPRSFSSELLRALKKHEFIPYAQPLVDSVSRKVIGIEILMRWKHPTQGLVRPDLFIPQAEESGLIVPMTVSLLKDTAKILKQHHQLIPKDFHVGVNITAQHCKGMKLLFDSQEFLAELKDSRVNLVLELTERQELETTDHVIELFTRLNNMGVLLAIDDFGTGHSSLSYLKDFKVGCLKIDMSFIKQIGEGSISEHLIDNIIDLGKRLSLTLVAEGVENEKQASFLEEKGVAYLQGYMFGKPMPLSDALIDIAGNK